MSSKRWRFHERYGARMFPNDKRGDAPKLIRLIYSEPPGFINGAVVKGLPGLNVKHRAERKKYIGKARKKLDSFRGQAQ
jgi:hypothetical protein